MKYSYQEAPQMFPGAFFHGEDYYKCPHCGQSYEFHDLKFERKGIIKVEKGIYRCFKCQKLMRCE